MRFRWLWLTLTFMLAACAAFAQEEPEIPSFRRVVIHDPSVIRTADGMYYIYGSHMAAAKSENLIDWEVFSPDAQAGCTLVDNVKQEMREALEYAETNTFWAPDVQQLADGKYYLYYWHLRRIFAAVRSGAGGERQPGRPLQKFGRFPEVRHAGLRCHGIPQRGGPAHLL